MIDQTLEPTTEQPVIREVLMTPAAPGVEAARWRDHVEGNEPAELGAPSDEYVQWGRCGLVPAALAHEPQA